MNRCPGLLALALLPTLGLGLCHSGQAQGISPTGQTHGVAAPVPQRIPPIAPGAKLGLLRVVQPPEVLLDGQPARLSPGARIRGQSNLIVMSGTLLGQELTVAYVRDSLQLVQEVWILNPLEIQARRSP